MAKIIPLLPQRVIPAAHKSKLAHNTIEYGTADAIEVEFMVVGSEDLRANVSAMSASQIEFNKLSGVT